MYGCEGNILQLLKLPDGTVKVLVEGSKRIKILDFKDNDKFIDCEYTHYQDLVTKDEDLIPLAMTAVRRLEKLTSCLLYTSPSPRDGLLSRMPSSA